MLVESALTVLLAGVKVSALFLPAVTARVGVLGDENREMTLRLTNASTVTDMLTFTLVVDLDALMFH